MIKKILYGPMIKWTVYEGGWEQMVGCNLSIRADKSILGILVILGIIIKNEY